MPEMPAPFEPIGPLTHMEGELSGTVTVTLPIPSSVEDDAIDALMVMRYDEVEGAWRAIPPQVDRQARTLSVPTTEFSTWGISSWELEQAIADFETWLGNQLSTGSSIWLVDRVARITTNVSRPECRYDSLTLDLDTDEFVDNNYFCVKYAEEVPTVGGPDGRTEGQRPYRLHISNGMNFPVRLELPEGVRVIQVVPQPANPVSQLLSQIVGPQQGFTILPGAAQLVLEVDPEVINDRGTLRVTGTLDFSGVVMDLSLGVIQNVTGFFPEDTATLAASASFMTLAGCVADKSEAIANDPKLATMTVGELMSTLVVAAQSCMSDDVVMAVIGEIYDNHRASGDFTEKVEQVARRVITVAGSLGYLTEAISTVIAVASGDITYRLDMTVDNPTSRLPEALPEPDSGGFDDAGSAPAFGGYLDTVGTPCHYQQQPPPWVVALSQPGEHLAQGQYDYQGSTAMVRVAYVGEYKSEVRDTFEFVHRNAERCESGRAGVDAHFIDVRPVRLDLPYGVRFTAYSGRSGWLDGSDGAPIAHVSVYDSAQGVVTQIMLLRTSGADDIPDGDVEDALEYVLNKLDLTLGTSYTIPR
ncbi:hypothetical protein KIK06_11720 [Nocardiopsis sp. EMB25]|uniref:hypothetical protein n=1 Tax=Nocardiopsis sp. EMB25 TaxID=2835867 RepID=UPI00228508C5|nr:hypothetical protein [Nocardiopsis sp. EMB25]MCY9784560.1 hypothetical protein [Nocardiopsis sp. EMB25]